MALWDVMDDVFGSGKSSAGKQGQEYYQPYYEGGTQDYNQFRNYLSNQNNLLNQYGNPADWMWRNAGTSPQEFYQNLMEGYTETPQAQYEQQQMENAINRGASASGMAGSGAYFKALQENSGNIIARDQDRYYNNVLRGSDQQQRYLDDFRRRQEAYERQQQENARMGYDAAGKMADYGGMEEEGNSDIWSGIGNVVGGIAGMFF